LATPALESSPADAGLAEAALCRACRIASPPFLRAVAYGLYQDRMKAAIHALKYDRLHAAAHGLGRMLAEAIAQLADDAPAEMLVVPVPLHKTKYAERGFNQARSLAVHALRFLRKTHPQWRLTLASSTLMRLRATESQAGLTFRQRRLNVRAAFSVSAPAAVARKDILLIDDIFTTGATVGAAAQALVRAGAASVRVATLARARLHENRRGSSEVIESPDLPPQRQRPVAGDPGLPPQRQRPVAGDPGLPPDSPAAITQAASIYSLQGQPSS